MASDKKKIKEKITITLSDAQCLEVGKQQADKELLYAKIEEELKAKSKDFRDRLNKLWDEIQELAQQQKDKQRVEEVEVVEIEDLERCKIIIARASNEREILRSRPMTLNEIAEARQKSNAARQKDLAFDAKPAAETGGEENMVKLDKKRKKKSFTVVESESNSSDGEIQPNDEGVVSDEYAQELRSDEVF